MDKQNGGPAHPVVSGPNVYSTGMSLRDWFAGQVLSGLALRRWEDNKGNVRDDVFELWAAGAYATADAMIAERERHDG